MESSVPILSLRGVPVIIDADPASLYGVETRVINQAVKRNLDRFPEDFLFQLTGEEKRELITNCDHLRKLKASKSLPYAFSEHGALMASNVLKCQEAVKMSLFIVRAFIKQRDQLAQNADILRRLSEIEKNLLEHDTALYDLYCKLIPMLEHSSNQNTNRKRIGFDSSG